MTNNDVLDECWRRLCAYRDLPELIMDERDCSNYHGRYFLSQREVLRKNDPTGLGEAMLLLAMAQATIDSAQIRLSAVIFVEGIVERLRQITMVMQSIREIWGDAIDDLLSRAEKITQGVSSPKLPLSVRELAVCLRDAVFSLELDLHWRWLNYTPDIQFDASSLRLSPTVLTFTDFHQFIDAFYQEMPAGFFLVHVNGATVFALNVPGRQAYLSALSVCPHSGVMRESSGNAQHGVPSLSLDQTAPHYPIWQSHHGRLSKSDQSAMVWGSLQEIGRDPVLWALMLTEILKYQTAWLTPFDISPAESLRRALGSVNSESSLPALRKPAWSAKQMTIKEGVASLALTAWEQSFLADALLIPDEMLLPTGKVIQYLCADTLALTDRKDQAVGGCRITPFDDSVIGCRDEVEQAREQVFMSNLRRWLVVYGNTYLKKMWDQSRPLLTTLAEDNLNAMLETPGAKLCELNSASVMHSVHLYRQDPKRTGYRPLCMLDKKTPADHLVVIRPDNCAEIAQVLAVDVAKLPQWMHGWERDTGSWISTPASGYAAWRFVDELFMSFSIAVAMQNLNTNFPPTRKATLTPSKVPGLE